MSHSELAISQLFKLVEKVYPQFWRLVQLVMYSLGRLSIAAEVVQPALGLQRLHSLVLELGQVALQVHHLGQVAAVVRLALHELGALVRQGESCEEEGLDGERKEAVLGLLAILVHNVTDDGEIDLALTVRLCLQQELIAFRIPM